MVQKRPAVHAARGAAKRPRKDPVAEKCEEVAGGLEHAAAEVPEVVRGMLASMLEDSIGVCKDQRHKYQDAVAGMICSVLEGVEATLTATLEAARAAVDGEAAAKAEREAAVETTAKAAEETAAEMESKKLQLAEAAQKFKACKAAVKAAEQARSLGDHDLKDATSRKNALEGALKDFVGPLAEGTVPEADVTETISTLKTTLKAALKENLPDSMMTTLPTSLAKPPSARGPFDVMVVTQLSDEVNKRIAAFDVSIQEAGPASEERAAVVKSAEAAFAEASSAQIAAADAFTAARGAGEDAKKALKEAEQQVKALGPEAKMHKQSLDDAEVQLQLFQQGPLTSCRALKERVTPPPEPEPAEAAAEAEDVEGAVEVEADEEAAGERAPREASEEAEVAKAAGEGAPGEAAEEAPREAAPGSMVA